VLILGLDNNDSGNLARRKIDGEKVLNLWFSAKDLNEAFEIIPEITTKGSICLLSPAAASYDQFKNFEHRGDLFKKLARGLAK